MRFRTTAWLFALFIAVDSFALFAAEPPHLPTPSTVKGVYINHSILGTPRFWNLVEMTERTELNTFVIDIHSHGGAPILGSDETARALLTKLHEKNIYCIARVVVFQGGNSGWHDPSSRERWEQVRAASFRAIAVGFDEINYDYVRYGAANEPKSATPVKERAAVIRSFWKFLKEEVRDAVNQPISVDIFGYTFLAPQHSIGQSVEDAILYFDYVMPMPYPSHWSKGSFGLDIPGHHPYETVHQSLDKGWERVKNQTGRIAELRVWIQAFGLASISPLRKYHYGPTQVRAQIKACEDSGCVGWVLWNANSAYQESYFLTK